MVNLHSLHISSKTDAEIIVGKTGYCKVLDIKKSTESKEPSDLDIFLW